VRQGTHAAKLGLVRDSAFPRTLSEIYAEPADADVTRERLRRATLLHRTGLALSSEQNRDRLLETILVEAQGVLTEIMRLMDLKATVEITQGHETSKLNVKGDGLGVLIGRRGEKLASLQHIVNLMVAQRDGPQLRIMVDVENYRGRREDQLRDVADRAAKRVLQTGKIIQLEAMPAVERRIVHMALIENPRIRTQSVGVEPNRRIVILPANQVESR